MINTKENNVSEAVDNAKALYAYNLTTEYTDSNGNKQGIIIFYNDSSLSSYAQIVANDAKDVFTYFCNTLGFNSPVPDPTANGVGNTKNYYSIFIDYYLTGYIHTCNYSFGKENSYITLSPEVIKDGLSSIGLAYALQQGIQRTYKICGNYDAWIQWGAGNLAAAIYAEYKNTLSTHWEYLASLVQDYYNTAYEALSEYGVDNWNRAKSLVWWLHLYQTLGGIEGIKSIYYRINSIRSNYSSYTAFNYMDILSAIDLVEKSTVQAGQTRDLRYALERFGYQSIHGLQSYNMWRGIPCRNVRVPTRALKLGETNILTIDYTGYGYYKLSSSPRTVKININVGNTDPSNFSCYIVETSGDIITWKSTLHQLKNTPFTLTYQFQSASATDLVIVVENTSLSDSVPVLLTVEI